METLKPARIKDVAIRAGLSSTTVSRYLNGALVLPKETSSRIDDAVKTLGYQPNVTAQRLSKGRSDMLGFATSDVAYPMFAAIASAAEAEAEALGLSLVVHFTRNRLQKELDLIARISSRHVDGIILRTAHVASDELKEAIRASRRIVLIDEDIEDVAAPKILADSIGGTSAATRHLLEHGHTNLAFVGGQPELSTSRERFKGFQIVMQEAGIEIDPAKVKFGAYSQAYGAQAFRELWALPDPPTGIVNAADSLALGIMTAANERGISIPADLSIVGFDDLDIASLLAPPLTTIRQSPDELGRKAVAALVNLIEGGPMPTEIERIEVELVSRGSVAPPKRHASKLRRGTSALT